jgi:Holliday junction DNA helicase RuvA
MSPSLFIQAIQLQDKSMLTKLPGVGSKTAERILIEMRDILKDSCLADLHLSATVVKSSAVQEAISALEALGYKSHEAAKVVKTLDQGIEDAQTLIKLALKQLAKC